MSLNNWRWADTPPKMREAFPDFLRWVEIRSDEGKWINPDCAYECAYCLACLGCLRKLFPPDGSDPDDVDAHAERSFHCERSPDGDHHLVENPEKN